MLGVRIGFVDGFTRGFDGEPANNWYAKQAQAEPPDPDLVEEAEQYDQGYELGVEFRRLYVR